MDSRNDENETIELVEHQDDYSWLNEGRRYIVFTMDSGKTWINLAKQKRKAEFGRKRQRYETNA